MPREILVYLRSLLMVESDEGGAARDPRSLPGSLRVGSKVGHRAPRCYLFDKFQTDYPIRRSG